jgi:hypothetical protein
MNPRLVALSGPLNKSGQPWVGLFKVLKGLLNQVKFVRYLGTPLSSCRQVLFGSGRVNNAARSVLLSLCS